MLSDPVLPPDEAADEEEGEEKESDEHAQPAGDVAVPDEESLGGVEVDPAGKGRLLPPGGLGEDPAALVDERTDARVAAADDVAAGLDGAEGTVAEVLAVAGGISPPAVVGDDGEQLGTGIADVFRAEFAVDGLVADGAAERDAATFAGDDVEGGASWRC